MNLRLAYCAEFEVSEARVFTSCFYIVKLILHRGFTSCFYIVVLDRAFNFTSCFYLARA